MQDLFREEAVSWYSVCNGVASAVTRSQPYWAVVGAAWPYGMYKKCPSSQSNLWEVLKEAWGEMSSDYLNKLTARITKVCKAVIAANGEFFDESKVWRTKLLFQIKITISNLDSMSSIHFATHLMNNSVNCHGKRVYMSGWPHFLFKSSSHPQLMSSDEVKYSAVIFK